MELPTTKTPILKCLKLGRYTAQMLSKFPEHAVLADLAIKMTSATTALDDSQKSYAGSVLAIIALRVDVRFNDWKADNGVRRSLRVAELADGKKGGAYATHLFPNGSTPVIKPVGATQVVEMTNLEGRYDALAARWSEAATEKAAIVALRTNYEAALKARHDGGVAAAAKRAARDLVKEDFLDVYAAIAGAVRTAFPRDRAMQDLFFDAVSDGTKKGNDDDETEADDESEPPAVDASGGASAPA